MTPPKIVGIPVSPLPGETLGDNQASAQAQAIGSTSLPQQPIPVTGQVEGTNNGIVAQGLPLQQPVIQAQPFHIKQPIVGEAASMGMTRISGEVVSSRFSVTHPLLTLSGS